MASSMQPSIQQPLDAAQRERALATDMSFAISAPAGSGKTELLIQRILKLCGQVQNPEEILAITFTRKAAQEMRNRIFDALQAARGPEPAADHQRLTWQLARRTLEQDQACGWQLLDNPNRLKLLTIDGFCHQLAKRTPLLAAAGAEPKVSDDPQALYRQATLNLMARLEQQDAIAEPLALLLNHLNHEPGRLTDLLCSLLEKREQWLAYLVGQDLDALREQLEANLQQLIHDTLHALSERLHYHEPDLIRALDYVQRNRDGLKPQSALHDACGLTALPGTTSAAIPAWQGITELLVTQGGTWRKRFDKTVGIPAATKKADKEQVAEIKAVLTELQQALEAQGDTLSLLAGVGKLPPDQYQQGQWQVLAVLSQVLPLLVAELYLVFNETGEVDYAQVGQAALAALGSDEQPSDLALLLDYRINHILVDEFQDTSSLQYHLLQKLTAGWAPDDGRTLMIVGDGMQSIYGFRNTKVDLFLAARRFGLTDTVQPEALDLTVNFRSHPGVVDWVNQVFSQAMPAAEDLSHGAVPYSPATAHLPDHSDAGVQVHAFADDGSGTRASEAQFIATTVQTLQQQQPDDSVAILVRDRNALRDLIPALRQQGIQWQAVDIDPLADLGIISDLLTLTLALLNPADRIAWFSLLRGPWCGLSLADLLLLSQSSGDTLLDAMQLADVQTQVSTEQLPHLQRLAEVLSLAYQNRCRKSLRQWIEGAWLALGGPATTLDPHELNNCSAFFDLLEQYDDSGRITRLPQFKEAIARLYADSDNSADNPVQIMTLHKSKGLEFDHVILPALDKGSRPNQGQLFLWHERMDDSGQPRLLMGPVSRTGYDHDPIYEFINSELATKNRLESARLLYVGATRAIKNLYLTAMLKETEDKEGNSQPKPPAANSLLAHIWPTVAEQSHWHSDSAASLTDEDDWVLDTSLQRFVPDWQLPTLPHSDLLVDSRGHEYVQGSQLDPLSLAVDLQPAMNQTYRQLLLRISRDGIEQWPAARADELASLAQTLLAQQHCFDSSAVETVLAGLRAHLDDSEGRWLLAEQHQDLHQNWPLVHHHAGQFEQVWISRTFLSEGQRWLVEFDLSPSEEDFAAALTDYRSRLQSSYAALSHWSAEPVTVCLYAPLLKSRQILEF